MFIKLTSAETEENLMVRVDVIAVVEQNSDNTSTVYTSVGVTVDVTETMEEIYDLMKYCLQ